MKRHRLAVWGVRRREQETQAGSRHEAGHDAVTMANTHGPYKVSSSFRVLLT